MSLRALHLAVRNRLKDSVVNGGLALTARECEVMGPDGRPPARCGERFVAVHGGGCSNSSRDDLDEVYHLYVTVTLRAARVPPDRWGTDLIDKATTGMDDLCQSVKVSIHKDAANDVVIRAANILLGAGADGFSGINGFVESLIFENMGDDAPKGPDWFSADPEDLHGVGFARTLRFGGARRVQTLESQV